MKFGFVFLFVLGASTAWAFVGRETANRASDDAPVAGNQRLTALTGAALYILLIAIVVTVVDLSGLLIEHYMVGLLLIPPVVLKLASTGYRFVRYYQGSLPYRQAGAPAFLLRFVIAPVLVVSTVVVFASGVELWLFGLRFGSGWMLAHTLSAVVVMVAGAAHLPAHLRRSVQAVGQEVVAPRREAITARSLVVASLLLGAVLAIASLIYVSPFPPGAGGA